VEAPSGLGCAPRQNSSRFYKPKVGRYNKSS
jgi:hypothetical protein